MTIEEGPTRSLLAIVSSKLSKAFFETKKKGRMKSKELGLKKAWLLWCCIKLWLDFTTTPTNPLFTYAPTYLPPPPQMMPMQVWKTPSSRYIKAEDLKEYIHDPFPSVQCTDPFLGDSSCKPNIHSCEVLWKKKDAFFAFLLNSKVWRIFFRVVWISPIILFGSVSNHMFSYFR